VVLRQAAADRVDGARVLTALESVISAFKHLLATKCVGQPTLFSDNDNAGGLQMIIFPLMTTWIWFQIITASSLPLAGPPIEDSSDANALLFPIGVSFERG
jgi:hypothetical protein